MTLESRHHGITVTILKQSKEAQIYVWGMCFVFSLWSIQNAFGLDINRSIREMTTSIQNYSFMCEGCLGRWMSLLPQRDCFYLQVQPLKIWSSATKAVVSLPWDCHVPGSCKTIPLMLDWLVVSTPKKWPVSWAINRKFWICTHHSIILDLSVSH